MMVPRRFFVALPVGLLLVTILFFGLVRVQLGAPTSSSQWCFEMNRRKLESARRMAAPKLALVGGSGALFGLNARQLENDLGEPVINLGTHAALGVTYILDWVRPALTPGDTVLLCLEYELYDWSDDDKAAWAGDIYTDYLMARDPEYFRCLPWRDQAELSLSLPLSRLKHGLTARFSSRVPPAKSGKFTFYDPALIDTHGDLSDHSRKRADVQARLAPERTEVLARGLSPGRGGFPAIHRFCRWAQDHRIRVLATFPNLLLREEYDSGPARATIQAIQQFYAAEGVPVLGSAQEAMLPRSDFLDTCYHLTSEAAQARTERLMVHLTQMRAE
jgi:hypothetical protein